MHTPLKGVFSTKQNTKKIKSSKQKVNNGLRTSSMSKSQSLLIRISCLSRTTQRRMPKLIHRRQRLLRRYWLKLKVLRRQRNIKKQKRMHCNQRRVQISPTWRLRKRWKTLRMISKTNLHQSLKIHQNLSFQKMTMPTNKKVYAHKMKKQKTQTSNFKNWLMILWDKVQKYQT